MCNKFLKGDVVNPTKVAEIGYAAVSGYMQARGITALPWAKLSTFEREEVILDTVAVQRGVTRQATHKAWVMAQVREGWSYGPFPDDAKKLHPHICEYSELDVETRITDAIFAAVVRAAL
jgi:hypothetical protein